MMRLEEEKMSSKCSTRLVMHLSQIGLANLNSKHELGSTMHTTNAHKTKILNNPQPSLSCSQVEMSMEDKRPKIGVGVAIHDKQGNVVMGVRSGSHGAGTYLFPLLHMTPKIEYPSCKIVHVLYFVDAH
jgi:hypothetical protein